MLAKHGPWTHHVRVQGVETMLEVEKWLTATGKKLNVDWESLVEAIQHPNNKKIGSPSAIPGQGLRVMIEPIIFVNDLSIATYIKMKWGGR